MELEVLWSISTSEIMEEKSLEEKKDETDEIDAVEIVFFSLIRI